MDESRRVGLHTDAGGDYDEENEVNYLQILLSDYIPQCGRQRMFADMDEWGYSFRLGSAQAWFEQDAEDTLQWMLRYNLLRSVHEITDAATTCLFAPAQKISIVAYASYAPLEII